MITHVCDMKIKAHPSSSIHTGSFTMKLCKLHVKWHCLILIVVSLSCVLLSFTCVFVRFCPSVTASSSSLVFLFFILLCICWCVSTFKTHISLFSFCKHGTIKKEAILTLKNYLQCLFALPFRFRNHLVNFQVDTIFHCCFFFGAHVIGLHATAPVAAAYQQHEWQKKNVWMSCAYVNQMTIWKEIDE